MNMHVLRKTSQLAIITLFSTGSFVVNCFGCLSLSFMNPTIQIGSIANAQQPKYKRAISKFNEHLSESFIKQAADAASKFIGDSLASKYKEITTQQQAPNPFRFVGRIVVTSNREVYYYDVMTSNWFVSSTTTEDVVPSDPPTDVAVVSKNVFQNSQGDLRLRPPASEVIYRPDRNHFYKQ